jgi:hypothetical protein
VGDIIRTIYKELFIVQLEHAAFASSLGSRVFEELSIRPDETTTLLFERYNMSYKCIGNQLICFIRSTRVSSLAKEPQIPFVGIVEPLQLRFYITASQRFINSSYVINAGTSYVYEFTNKVNNEQSGKAYLTKSIDNYSLSKSYDYGTLVLNGGDLYTALKPVNASGLIPISNTSYWKNLAAPAPVVNDADLTSATSLASSEPIFGVIEIFSDGIPENYRLLNDSNELLSPVYHIKFKSK